MSDVTFTRAVKHIFMMHSDEAIEKCALHPEQEIHGLDARFIPFSQGMLESAEGWSSPLHCTIGKACFYH